MTDTTQAATESQTVDISALDVPVVLTVAEINFVMSVLGTQPFTQVAGIINKIKSQAEAHIATVQITPPAEAVPAAVLQ
jgi:hypothetical protein